MKVTSKIKKRKRVLFYEPSTGYGGSARCLLGWLKYIDEKKVKPFVAVHFDGPAIKAMKRSEIRVINIFYFKFLQQLSMVIKGSTIPAYIVFIFEFILNIIPVTIYLMLIIQVKKISLVDVNSSIITGIPGILAAKFTGTPCVCHIHDTRLMTTKEKLFTKTITKFFILTKKAMHLYSDLGKERMVLLYNALDLQAWKTSDQTQCVYKELAISSDDIVVGMVGRITKGKGHSEFLKAAEMVSKERQDVTFLIVGGAVFTDKGYERYLWQLAAKSVASERIIFTGWRDDVREVMSSIDILAFPTTTFPEGFPVTCVEAMALSKPVIASDIPGPSEIVVDNVTGFLVGPGDEKALADKILYLIKNPLASKEMGLAGRKHAESFFDVKKSVKKIEEVYEKIVG